MDIKKLAAIYETASGKGIRRLTVKSKNSTVRMTLSPLASKNKSSDKKMAEATVASREDVRMGHGGSGEEKFDIVSSQIGFFSRYNPKTKKQYVKLRDQVKKGVVVACIKSMYLIYEIEADRAGKIVEFLVEEGQPVEYHQPLMRLLMLPAATVEAKK